MGGCYVLSLLVGLCDFLLGGVEIDGGEGVMRWKDGVDEMDEGMKIKSCRISLLLFFFCGRRVGRNILWDGWDGAMDGGKGSSIIGGYGLFIFFTFLFFYFSIIQTFVSSSWGSMRRR